MRKIAVAIIVLLLSFGCIGYQPANPKIAVAQKPETTDTQQAIEQQTGWGGIGSLDPEKPIACHIETNGVSSDMRMLGGMLRQDIRGQINTTVIIRNGYAFSSMAQTANSSCKWIRFDLNNTAQKNAASSFGASTEQITQPMMQSKGIGTPSVSCKNDNFGAEVFETRGKICEIDEIIRR